MNDSEALLQRYLTAWNTQPGAGLAVHYEPDGVRVSPLGTAGGQAA